MVRLSILALLACVASLSSAAEELAGSRAPFDPDIAYVKHILPNGLTLLIHEDHKAPIVAVNVWYHVGSKDERPGRTGFAHLFEHLMFNGSENHNDEYFRPLEAVGGTKMNGTTAEDRTNYFQNVPTSALDLALWLESDRMGHLLGAIDQAKLDEQRGVVLNEKRQNEDRPYGKAQMLIAAQTYPPGHPYSWTPIGSKEDLDAATVADVKAWFVERYGAANAVLTVAGDVQPEDVKRKVELYFGDIASGPALTRHGAWTAKMNGIKRATMQDRVPQARITKVWNVPGYCERDTNLLSLASDTLAGGKTSRLYQRLVYRDRSATQVYAYVNPNEIGSQFFIDALVAPGADAAQVEQAMDEELARFLKQGPTPAEVARVRTGLEASFVRGLETIDGFGGKSNLLAENQTYCGRPDWYKQEFRWIAQASVQDVRQTAQTWLSDGQFVLITTPLPDHQTAQVGADRSKLPAVGPAPKLELPPLQRTRLSNGMELLLAERHAAPVVQVILLFDAGYAADSGPRLGTAKMTLDMLDEGAGARDSLAIAIRQEELAARFSAQSTLDTSFVLMNILASRLPESLQLLSDLVLRPSFPAKELERLKAQSLAAIQQEKSQPNGLAQRIYPALVFGADHAYGKPRSGNGDEASVAAMTVADLRDFQSKWLRPDNARILIVGDTTLVQIKPLLERAFGSWKSPGVERGRKTVAEVRRPSAPRVFLIDKPDTEQTLLLAAHVAPPRADPDDVAMNLVSSVLGGLFTSRLNLNLREDKHWSYNAGSQIGNARGQRPFVAYSSVQIDRTADSLREMVGEIENLLGTKPITAEEVSHAADNLVVGLPGENETSAEVAGSYLDILQFGLKDSYFNDLVPAVQALGADQVNAAAKKLLHPESLTWVVVGDLARIEAPVRALKLGEVKVLGADGQILR
ncbi:MAG: M16 family metallopeptidase [Panacagrimonas sp.]